jgi:hypothetical protein
LLVDADLRSYPPSNVGRFVDAGRLAHGGIALPLWCRPRGQGNSTDFLACPLLFAASGARIRQPLAGQMLLTKTMLAAVDVDSLPDNYGIDVALTTQALNLGLPVDQVAVPFPRHDAGGNSHRIMENVATALLGCLANGAIATRRDVSWPENWWDGHPVQPPTTRSLRGLIEQVAPFETPDELDSRLGASPSEMRDFWCDRLAAAARLARAGHPVPELVADMVYPFLLHAEYRRRLQVDLAGAEAYVSELCTRLAAAVT